MDPSEVDTAVGTQEGLVTEAQQAVTDAENNLVNETGYELERRYDNQLWTAYNYLWGAPAVEACDVPDCDPATPAVAEIIGAEGRMRTADEQYNAGSILISQAQKALAEN